MDNVKDVRKIGMLDIEFLYTYTQPHKHIKMSAKFQRRAIQICGLNRTYDHKNVAIVD